VGNAQLQSVLSSVPSLICLYEAIDFAQIKQAARFDPPLAEQLRDHRLELPCQKPAHGRAEVRLSAPISCWRTLHC
jgi:hypothetical protein